MTQLTNRRVIPKSVRQKRILDVAEANPDASLEEISDEVPGTTTAVVEAVLDEYGDPAVEDSNEDSKTDWDAPEHGIGPDESTDDAPVEKRHESIGEPTPESSTPTDLIGFPNRQRELLESIYEHPEATQRELATDLDVSRTTVYNRVRNIEGLEWGNRHEFVKAIFNGEGGRADGESNTDDGDQGNSPDEDHDGEQDVDRSGHEDGGVTAISGWEDRESLDGGAAVRTDSAADLGDLIERVETIESHLDDLVATSESDGLSTDPELVHKVAHACLDSDVISEAEELRILRNLLE